MKRSHAICRGPMVYLYIDDARYGKDSIGLSIPISALCGLYGRWDKPEKAEPYYEQQLLILEKQYGAKQPGAVQYKLCQ
jgi:hypothetical protein